MSAETSNRAFELRRVFDRSFAEVAQSRGEGEENLLAIRVASNAYAVRLAELAGLYVDRRIVPLPTPIAELLGVVGLRVGVMPVYSLGALLSEPRASETPRWIFASSDGVAFGFDELESYARVARSDIASMPGAARAHVVEAATIAGVSRAVVSVASLISTIKLRTAAAAATKER